MYKADTTPEAYFMPVRRNHLPPLPTGLIGVIFILFLLISFFFGTLCFGSLQKNYLSPVSIETRLREKALDRFQQNDIQGAMTILTNAIAIEKNKLGFFDLFDPLSLEALQQREFEAQLLMKIE